MLGVAVDDDVTATGAEGIAVEVVGRSAGGEGEGVVIRPAVVAQSSGWNGIAVAEVDGQRVVAVQAVHFDLVNAGKRNQGGRAAVFDHVNHARDVRVHADQEVVITGDASVIAIDG